MNQGKYSKVERDRYKRHASLSNQSIRELDEQGIKHWRPPTHEGSPPVGEYDCSICGCEIEKRNGWKYGNNANPVTDGNACDTCNDELVIPMRLGDHRTFSKNHYSLVYGRRGRQIAKDKGLRFTPDEWK